MSVYKDYNYHWSDVNNLVGIIETFATINSKEVIDLETTYKCTTLDDVFDIPKNRNIDIVVSEYKSYFLVLYQNKKYIMKFKIGLYVDDYFTNE